MQKTSWSRNNNPEIQWKCKKIELCGVARAFAQFSEYGPRSKKFGHSCVKRCYPSISSLLLPNSTLKRILIFSFHLQLYEFFLIFLIPVIKKINVQFQKDEGFPGTANLMTETSSKY